MAVCRRKLVVNLSLFLVHSGNFFRSLSPQKSKDSSAAVYPSAHSMDSFLFLIVFPFLIHTPKCFFPCSEVSAYERWSSQLQLHFTLFLHFPGTHLCWHLAFVSSQWHQCQGQLCLSCHPAHSCSVFFSIFCLQLLKNPFSTRGSVCVHLLSFLTASLLSSFTVRGLHLSCPGGCARADLSPPPSIQDMACTDCHEKNPFSSWMARKQIDENMCKTHAPEGKG